MNAHGKLSAILFAILIAYIGVYFPVWPATETFETDYRPSSLHSIGQHTGPVFYMEETVQTARSDGWNSEVKHPRLIFGRQIPKDDKPVLRDFGKNYVFRHKPYTANKSILFYPFHGFF